MNRLGKSAAALAILLSAPITDAGAMSGSNAYRRGYEAGRESVAPRFVRPVPPPSISNAEPSSPARDYLSPAPSGGYRRNDPGGLVAPVDPGPNRYLPPR